MFVQMKKSSVLKIPRVIVSERTVIAPNMICYLDVCSDQPMEYPFIFEPARTDKALLSLTCGNYQTIYMTVEVFNEFNDSFVNFNKGN